MSRLFVAVFALAAPSTGGSTPAAAMDSNWAVTWELFPIGNARSSVLLDVGRPCIWRLLVMMDRPKLMNVGGVGSYATMSALPRWFAVRGHGAAMAHQITH